MWGPCHHCMAGPRDADGGDGQQGVVIEIGGCKRY